MYQCISKPIASYHQANNPSTSSGALLPMSSSAGDFQMVQKRNLDSSHKTGNLSVLKSPPFPNISGLFHILNYLCSKFIYFFLQYCFYTMK